MAGILTIEDGGVPVDIDMDTGMVTIADTGMATDMVIDMVTTLVEKQGMLPDTEPDHGNPYKVTFIETGQMESKIRAQDLRQDQVIHQ